MREPVSGKGEWFMRIMSSWSRILLAGILLSLGCSTPVETPTPAGRCQDRSRFGYPESLPQDQLGKARGLIQSIGAESATLISIPGNRPDIVNRMEVAQTLERVYPPLLRDQGISGTARVAILVTESGNVEFVEISESAGHPELDEAARSVAMQIEFTGLQSEGVPICYVTVFPISFTTR